jgi:hypothetical protein
MSSGIAIPETRDTQARAVARVAGDMKSEPAPLPSHAAGTAWLERQAGSGFQPIAPSTMSRSTTLAQRAG